MESFLKKNGKTLAIVAGGAAVIAGLIVLFSKTKDEETHDHHDDVEIKDETKFVVSSSAKHAIISGIKVQYEGEFLSIRTIAQICDATLKLAGPKFVALTKKDRAVPQSRGFPKHIFSLSIERRAHSNDIKKYIDLWDSYATALEEVIEGSQAEVLKDLGVSDNVWENSNAHFMNQGSQELMMLHATLPQKLKLTLASGKALSKDEFKQALGAQVALLKSEVENAGEYEPYLKRPEELTPIIQNRVNDEMFTEFGIEEEDILVSMRQHMMDPEVQQLMMQMQQAIMPLMSSMGMGGGMGGF